MGDNDLTLSVSDFAGTTDTQSYTITVINVNDAPVFTSTPVLTVLQDAVYSYTLIAKDVDLGDQITITQLISLPTWLTVTGGSSTRSATVAPTAEARVTGTPTNTHVGSYNLMAQVSDISGTTDVQAYTLEVINVNDPPVFASQPYTNDIISGYSFSSVISATDVDLEINVGEQLAFSVITGPTWLNLTDNGDGTGTISGAPDYPTDGLFPVELLVTDLGGLTSTQSFSLNVRADLINIYAPITGISTNTITVTDVSQLVVGDDIMIIQMQGATMSGNSINAINNAGRYEFHKIAAINGTVVTLVTPTVTIFDVAGKVQLVKYINFGDTSINTDLTAQPWDGSSGGVLLFTGGKITVNGSIDVSEQGFRAGETRANGEGIGGGLIQGDINAAGNSGGGNSSFGGVQQNGGGGGSSCGAGGTGGRQLLAGAPGQGGPALLPYFSSAEPRAFMGGGGGAGSGDNGGVNIPGGRGGGIVIISADELTMDGRSISSNGGKGASGGFETFGVGGTGGGGGGAAGTILLDVPVVSGTLTVNAAGGFGDGARGRIFLFVFINVPALKGGGAGAGGGTIWSPVPLPANVTTNVAGGGVINGDAGDGQDPTGGQAGCVIPGFDLVRDDGSLIVDNAGDEFDYIYNSSGQNTLREAIINADNGDVITIDSSLSGQTLQLTLGELYIDKDLSIISPVPVTVSGGGQSRLFNIVNGDLTLSGIDLISGTSTATGGGINLVGGNTLTLTHSTLYSHTSSGNGGAIYSGGNLTLQNVTAFGNRASNGAIYHDGGILLAQNSTVYSNATGGLWMTGSGTATLTHNTLVGNRGDNLLIGNRVNLFNNLMGDAVSGNDCTLSGGSIITQTSNLIEAHNGCGSPALSVDPLVGAVQAGQRGLVAPLPGSPAIDAGDGTYCPTSDQRGTTRPQINGCDLGAYEVTGYKLTVVGGNNQSADTGQPFAESLTVTVAAVNGTDPISGGQVSFVGPTTTLNASGTASAVITANSVAGSYAVTASVTGGLKTAQFVLTNTVGPAPGGVTDYLTLWLKGDVGPSATLDGDPVATWTGQSGYQHLLTNGTVNQQPTFQNEISDTINGYPVVRFDGVNDRIAKNIPDVDTNFAMFVVNTYNSGGEYSSIFSSGFDQNTRGSIQVDVGGGINGCGGQLRFFGSLNNGSLMNGVCAGTLSTTEPQLRAFVHRSGVLTSYFEGQAINQADPRDFQGRFNAFRVGSNRNTNTFWDGDIAEIAVYFDALTDLQIQQVHSYLALKYGLSLSNTDYIDSNGNTLWTTGSGYDNDIIGIGLDSNSALIQTTATDINGLVSITGSLATLTDGEFLLIGSDGVTLTTTANDVPVGYTIATSRTWSVEEQGDVGPLTVTFDISSLGADTGMPSGFALLIDPDLDFANATTIITASTVATNSVTFSNVDFADLDFFTLAYPKAVAPGGVSHDITLWLKADVGPDNMTDGGSVSAWTGQTLNQHILTQGTVNFQPTFQSEISDTINGFSVVRFDGANDLIQKSIPQVNTNFAIFVVNSYNSGTEYTSIFSSGFDQTVNGSVQLDVGGGTNGCGGQLRFFGSFNSGGLIPGVCAGALSTTEPQLRTFVHNAGVRTTYFEGQQLNQDIPRAFQGRFNAFRIGSNRNSNSFWDGDIAELVVYFDELNSQEIQQVHTYLALKYGLSLSNTDYIDSNGTVLWTSAPNYPGSQAWGGIRSVTSSSPVAAVAIATASSALRPRWVI